MENFERERERVYYFALTLLLQLLLLILFFPFFLNFWRHIMCVLCFFVLFCTNELSMRMLILNYISHRFSKIIWEKPSYYLESSARFERISSKNKPFFFSTLMGTFNLFPFSTFTNFTTYYISLQLIHPIPLIFHQSHVWFILPL